MTWLPRAALIALLLPGFAACTKVQARTPTPVPPLDAPDPPSRVIVPVSTDPMPEPVAATPPVTATPATPRPHDPQPASRPPEKPPATTTPPAPDPSTQPVLQTTSNTEELQRRAEQRLNSAETDLGKLKERDLNPNAKTQYDAVQGLIKSAREAIRAKNYVYAEQVASKAALMASLLVRD
jgi:hypothetical protein